MSVKIDKKRRICLKPKREKTFDEKMEEGLEEQYTNPNLKPSKN